MGDAPPDAAPLDHVDQFKEMYNLPSQRQKFELGSELVQTPVDPIQQKRKTNFTSNGPTERSFVAEKNSFMDLTGGFSVGTPRRYYQAGKV